MDIEHLNAKRIAFAVQANNQDQLTMNLHNINEDCLLQIFSAKSLGLKDLCSIAETCKHFQKIIRSFNIKELSIERKLNGDYIVKSRNYKQDTFKRSEVERIFKNFRFKQLQLLHLKNNVSIEDKRLFAKLNSLVELRLDCVKNCGAILKNFYPKLERFSYLKERITMANSVHYPGAQQCFNTLSAFISRHATLKSLDLSFSCNEICNIFIMGVISKSCNKLNELSLNLKGTTVAPLDLLQAIKSLRTLKLRMVSFENFIVFSSLTNLSELHLIDCRLPMSANQLSFLTHLTKLEIHRCFAFDVVNIISTLTNLEELKILRCLDAWSLSKEKFNKIVEMVKDRPNVLTLTCDFNFRLKNCDRNQKLILLRPCYRDQ